MGGDRSGGNGVYFESRLLLGYDAGTRFEGDCLREVGVRVLRVEGSSWKLTSCKQIDKSDRE